jgi:hypothetical protein
MPGTTTRTWRLVAGTATVALALAAIWNALILTALTAPPQPPGGNEVLFAWWRPLEWQTAGVHLLAALGFLALATLGGLLATLPSAAAEPDDRVAGLLIACGAFLGGLAHLVQLGAQQGVLAASATSTDPGALGAIGYTFDRVVAAAQLGAYATFATGMIALGMASFRRSRSAFAAASVLLGLGAAVLAVLTQADPLGIGDAAAATVAVILLPAWVWTGMFRVPGASAALAASS